MGEERRKEKDRGTEGGLPKPIPGIDAHIENEEKNGKQKKEKERSGSPTQLPRTIQSSPISTTDCVPAGFHL